MELSDLKGMHKLTGCDFSREDIKDEYRTEDQNCQVVRFVLDGQTYMAVEDPDDGYRSACRELVVSDAPVKNSFADVLVFCLHRKQGSSYSNADILEVYDAKTARLILEVGTDNSDDYYPSFVANFNPGAMWINAEEVAS